MSEPSINFLDCTLRDGGYYNAWDFSCFPIGQYLEAVHSAGVDVVELGFRTTKNQGFQGPCAFTRDEFIRSLPVPVGVSIGVMVNANELVGVTDPKVVLNELFPNASSESPVDLVRIACHVHEVSRVLPLVSWLKGQGYQVGINLMQVADRTEEEIKGIASLASQSALDILYFADSMGSLKPERTAEIVQWFRDKWHGAMGIHTHDNLGLALSNTLRALDEGVAWVDATVTGMGRGPGNARTEELAIELAERRGDILDLVPLLALIRKFFKPMQAQYGWGTNPYYYLSGKYRIHPTYIQSMLADSRYDDEDVFAAIEHLRVAGGKRFSVDTLDAARHFYRGNPHGNWHPKKQFFGRDVLLLGAGPGVAHHRAALEHYVRRERPLVLALNTQSSVDAECIDFRVACHPVRLLADCKAHVELPQPLITPYSMLPENVRESLRDKEILDFGLSVKEETFMFGDSFCITPTSLVVAYALAVVTSGNVERILMAGFDGYGGDDARDREMDFVLDCYQKSKGSVALLAVTPSRYRVPEASIYGL